MGIEFTCESIGLTQDELQQRVVQGLIDQVLDADHVYLGEVLSEVSKTIKSYIDAAVETIGKEHVRELVLEQVNTVIMQKTNQWGDAKGDSFTFKEYLALRAEQYLADPVDKKGQAKHNKYNTNWQEASTRLVWLIDDTFSEQIRDALGNVMKDIDGQLSEGLADSIQMQMKEWSERLKVVYSRKDK